MTPLKTYDCPRIVSLMKSLRRKNTMSSRAKVYPTFPSHVWPVRYFPLNKILPQKIFLKCKSKPQ